jgi:hypothetical protein
MQAMDIKSILTQQHSKFFPKKLITWRESSPGLQFLRRMRCPLRLAAGANKEIDLLFLI